MQRALCACVHEFSTSHSMYARTRLGSIDESVLYCIAGSVLAIFVVFVVTNSFLAVLDLTGRPAFLVKYKIQEEKTVPVSKSIRSHRKLLLTLFSSTCQR